MKAAIGAWIVGLTFKKVLAGIVLVGSMAHQMQQARKMRKAAKDADEARKGFEFVTEGEVVDLPIVYGFAKIGGIRVFHGVSSSFNFVESNADKTFNVGMEAGTSTTIINREFDIETGKWSEYTSEVVTNVSGKLDRTFTGSKNEFLMYQQALCQGPINACHEVIIEEDRFLDDPTLGNAWFKKNKFRAIKAAFRADVFFGNGAQPDTLMAVNFGERHTAGFTDIAYSSIYIRLDRENPQFSGGVPLVQFLVEGKLVRKVVNGVLQTERVFSNNPAWCLLDYLLTQPDLTVESCAHIRPELINLVSFEKGAAVCDRIVATDKPVGGKFWQPTEGPRKITHRDIKLYECNLIIDTSKPFRENITKMLSTMGDARLRWSQGQYHLFVEYPENNQNIPDVIYITDDDLVPEGEVLISRPSMASKLNNCTIRYHDASMEFKENSVSWPPKKNTTNFRGIGGFRYPHAASAEWKDAYLKIMPTHAVWSGVTGNTNLSWKFAVYVGGTYELNFAAKDTGNISITGPNVSFSQSSTGNNILKVNLSLSEMSIYSVEISATAGIEERAVAAFLRHTELQTQVWSTRDPAFTDIETQIRSDAVYKTMLSEDNDIELEEEVFFDGCTDYYHALAKAEEMVRTSRSASEISLSIIIKDKIPETGDFIPISSETLSLGLTEAFIIKVNEARINENGVCSIKGYRFDWTQLAWNVDDDQYIRPPAIFDSQISPPFDVQYISDVDGIYYQSSGKLIWEHSDPDLIKRYTVYTLTQADIVGDEANWRELGTSNTREYQLPALNPDRSYVFGVQAIGPNGSTSVMATTGNTGLDVADPIEMPVDIPLSFSVNDSSFGIRLVVMLQNNQPLFNRKIQLMRGLSDGIESAIFLTEISDYTFLDTDLVYDTDYYYWVRLVNHMRVEDSLGDWFGPESGRLLAENVNPTVPSNVANLLAVSNYGGTAQISWDAADYDNHAYTEIWRQIVEGIEEPPDINKAILVGSPRGNHYVDHPDEGVVVIYFARFVSTSNIRGAFTAYGYVHILQTVNKIISELSGRIESSHLHQSLSAPIALIDAPETGLVARLATVDGHIETLNTGISTVNQTVENLKGFEELDQDAAVVGDKIYRHNNVLYKAKSSISPPVPTPPDENYWILIGEYQSYAMAFESVAGKVSHEELQFAMETEGELRTGAIQRLLLDTVSQNLIFDPEFKREPEYWKEHWNGSGSGHWTVIEGSPNAIQFQGSNIDGTLLQTHSLVLGIPVIKDDVILMEVKCHRNKDIPIFLGLWFYNEAGDSNIEFHALNATKVNEWEFLKRTITVINPSSKWMVPGVSVNASADVNVIASFERPFISKTPRDIVSQGLLIDSMSGTLNGSGGVIERLTSMELTVNDEVSGLTATAQNATQALTTANIADGKSEAASTQVTQLSAQVSGFDAELISKADVTFVNTAISTEESARATATRALILDYNVQNLFRDPGLSESSTPILETLWAKEGGGTWRVDEGPVKEMVWSGSNAAANLLQRNPLLIGKPAEFQYIRINNGDVFAITITTWMNQDGPWAGVGLFLYDVDSNYLGFVSAGAQGSSGFQTHTNIIEVTQSTVKWGVPVYHVNAIGYSNADVVFRNPQIVRGVLGKMLKNQGILLDEIHGELHDTGGLLERIEVMELAVEDEGTGLNASASIASNALITANAASGVASDAQTTANAASGVASDAHTVATATASTVSSLQTTVNGHSGSIVNLQTAMADESGARAANIQQLAVKINDENLFSDPRFEDTNVSNKWQVHSGNWSIVAGSHITVTGQGEYVISSKYPFISTLYQQVSLKSGDVIKFSGEIKKNNTSAAVLGVWFYNNQGSNIHYASSGNFDSPLNQWVPVEFEFTVNDDNIAWCTFGFLVNSNGKGTGSSVQFRRPHFTRNVVVKSVVQLKSEVTNLSAEYFVKLNTGNLVSGFGMVNQEGSSSFGIMADKFWVAPAGTSYDVSQPPPESLIPFIVKGNQTYIKSAFIEDATLDFAKIKKGNVFDLTIADRLESTDFDTSTTGFRFNRDGTAFLKGSIQIGGVPANELVELGLRNNSFQNGFDGWVVDGPNVRTFIDNDPINKATHNKCLIYGAVAGSQTGGWIFRSEQALPATAGRDYILSAKICLVEPNEYPEHLQVGVKLVFLNGAGVAFDEVAISAPQHQPTGWWQKWYNLSGRFKAPAGTASMFVVGYYDSMATPRWVAWDDIYLAEVGSSAQSAAAQLEAIRYPGEKNKTYIDGGVIRADKAFVNKLYIENQAVTFTIGAYTAGSTNIVGNEAWHTIQSLYMEGSNEEVQRQITASGQVLYAWTNGGSKHPSLGFEIRVLFEDNLIAGPWLFDNGAKTEEVNESPKSGGFTVVFTHQPSSAAEEQEGTYKLQVRGLVTYGVGLGTSQASIRALYISELRR